MATTFTPSSIRIPPDLRDRIKRRAILNRRSFSSEAVTLIEAGLASAKHPTVWDEQLARERELVRELEVELDAQEVV